jgi:hypothetical protein
VIEARVVRAELVRRLGAVIIDFRSADGISGPWLPLEHAAWPSGVDGRIDLGDLGDLTPALIGLFARTLVPTAVDIRRRMLEHLGILPLGDDPLTADRLARALPPPPRPTDLWLVLRAASAVATDEPAHEWLASGASQSTNEALDSWFDARVAELQAGDVPTTNMRLRAEIAEVTSRLLQAEDDRRRSERSTLTRIDELVAEVESLRERLRRAEIDGTAGPS